MTVDFLIELFSKLFDSPFISFILAVSIAGIPLFVLMALNATVAVYVERKVSAFMMDRIGPMGQGPGLHAGPWGVLQTIADAVKLLIKEDTIPSSADKLLFKVAPFIIFIGAFLGIAVLPFSSVIQVVDINIGVLSALNNVAQFTISFWAEFASGTTEQTIFTNRNQTTSWTDRVEIYRYGTDVYFHVNNSSQGGSKNAFLASPSNGVWTHIVMVFDGGQAVNDDRIKIYYQGVKQSPTISASFNTITSTGATSLIGARTGSANKEYSGNLDELAIWNTALTSTQIQSIYNGTSTNLTKDLTTVSGSNLVYWNRMGD